MKTDRNKNNLKSEENMILKKSRRSDANVFPVENKGKGKIAKAKKRQVKGVIWKTVLQQKWLSMGCLLYTSPSPRDLSTSRMPSSA